MCAWVQAVSTVGHQPSASLLAAVVVVGVEWETVCRALTVGEASGCEFGWWRRRSGYLPDSHGPAAAFQRHLAVLGSHLQRSKLAVVAEATVVLVDSVVCLLHIKFVSEMEAVANAWLGLAYRVHMVLRDKNQALLVVPSASFVPGI